MNNIYNEIMMKHYHDSPYKKEMVDCTLSSMGVDPSCGDEIKLMIKLDNDKVIDMSFIGKGCAVCLSSASIMIDLMIGKTKKESLLMIDRFISFINGEEVDTTLLGDGIAFSNIDKMPTRKKCVLLSWNTLRELLVSNE